MKACWADICRIQGVERVFLKILHHSNQGNGEFCRYVDRNITDFLMIFFKFQFRLV